MKDLGQIYIEQTGLHFKEEARMTTSACSHPSVMVPLIIKAYLLLSSRWKRGRASQVEKAIRSLAPRKFRIKKKGLATNLSYYYRLRVENKGSNVIDTSVKWKIEVYQTTPRWSDSQIVQWKLEHGSKYPDSSSILLEEKSLATANLNDFKSCLNNRCLEKIGRGEVFDGPTGKPLFEVNSDLSELLEPDEDIDYWTER